MVQKFQIEIVNSVAIIADMVCAKVLTEPPETGFYRRTHPTGYFDSWFPPPIFNDYVPALFVSPWLEPRNKAIAVNNGEDIIAILPLFFWFVNFPSVDKPKQGFHKPSIPNQVVQRREESCAQRRGT